MYYIRKLSKLTTIAKIKNSESINEVPADLLKQELPTSSNTLSFWKCESLENTKDAMKAILLSTTGIEKSQFIIFDDDMLDKCGIRRDTSEEGKTGYAGFSNLHVNFCDLTYGKIGQIILMIKDIHNKQELIPSLSKDQVKECIKEVCSAGLLDTAKVDEHLLADIQKYGLDVA